MTGAPEPGHQDRHFATDRVRSDLRGRAVRGGSLVLASGLFHLLLRLGSLAVLARLLTPRDFGLVAMVTAVARIFDTLRTAGLREATVQSESIDHPLVSTLFWITAGVSVVLLLVLSGLAPALAWFYGEPALTGITIALALGGVCEGLTHQHQALLNRQMRFGAIAGVQASSALFSNALGIGLALLGAGYWALVCKQIAWVSARMGGTWIASGWIPGRPRRGVGAARMLSFGWRVTGTLIVRQLMRKLDQIIVGRFAGSIALGFYTRAYSLLVLPTEVNAPLNPVAISGLSRLQAEPERFRAFFRKALLAPVATGMPVVAFLFIDAGPALRAFLGPQWGDAVPVFQVLAPAAFVGTFSMATHWVHIACGRADRELRWGSFSLGVQALAVLIGAQWGLYGVAAAVSLTAVGLRYPAILFCAATTPLRPSDFLRVLWRPALASMGAALLLALAQRGSVLPESLFLGLFADLLVFGVAYVALWALTPGGIASLGEIVGLARELLESRRRGRT